MSYYRNSDCRFFAEIETVLFRAWSRLRRYEPVLLNGASFAAWKVESVAYRYFFREIATKQLIYAYTICLQQIRQIPGEIISAAAWRNSSHCDHDKTSFLWLLVLHRLVIKLPSSQKTDINMGSKCYRKAPIAGAKSKL